MKRGMLFLLMCILLQGMQIVLCQERNQSAASSRVSHDILVPEFCVLHECQEDEIADLTWFEWFGKLFDSCAFFIHIYICKMRLYLFSENMYESISLLQEKLAENAAELGNLKKALWYSQESLQSSVGHLAVCENQINFMKQSKCLDSQGVENLRDALLKYTQHVQSHIITMTDFAADEKASESWQLYENMLMQYFEKIQQVMQNIDECDAMLCERDDSYCFSAHQKAVLEDCMSSDFDPDMYD